MFKHSLYQKYPNFQKAVMATWYNREHPGSSPADTVTVKILYED